MHSVLGDVVTVERGDATLSVAVRAGTPTVVFLHGLAGHRGEWAPVCELLSTHMRLIVPDQRGHGSSFDPDRAPDVAATRWSDDVVACIESFASAPAIVVGQSMGSLVATRVAAQRPDLVRHLVLIEGGMDPMTETGLATLSGWFETWPTVFTTRQHAGDFFGAEQPSTPAWVDGLAASDAGLHARFDSETMLAAMRSLANEELWGLWQKLATPTTIVRATESMIADTDITTMLATRPEARLVEVAGGHDLHLDNPREVAAIINQLD